MNKIYRLGETRNLDTEEQRAKAQENRTIEFIISSDKKDRHGTRMNMDNWKLENFNSNPIVGYQHDVYGGGMCEKPDPDDVIGIGKAWFENSENKKLLIGSVTFETADINPKADKIFKKVLFGSLRAASVGIMPIGEGKYGEDKESEGKENETYYFDGQELLEFSIVNLPSNTDALKRNMTVQAQKGVEYLKRYINDTIKKDIDVNELRVCEVLELLDGKTDNYFARVLEKKEVEKKADELANKIDEIQSDIKKTLKENEPDLDNYFRKLKLEIYKRQI